MFHAQSCVFHAQSWMFNAQAYMFNAQAYMFNAQSYMFNAQAYMFNAQAYMFNAQSCWVIQAGLLSPLAAFTSGAYFLHNGRQWQWICEFYAANFKGIFLGP